MRKVRFCFSRVARRFTMRPRRPRAVSPGEHGVPAVRRRRGAGAGRGREPARLPGHGHHGGQALVLLQVVTSLSVYISCLFFGGLLFRSSNVRPSLLSDIVSIPSVARPSRLAWCGEVRAVRPPRRSPVLPNFNSRVALVCLHNSRKAAKKRPTSRQGSGSPRWVVVGLD